MIDVKKQGPENTPMQEINKISHHLPLPVLQDINNRIRDWLASGGNENDPYIEQQLRFAKNYLKLKSQDLSRQ